MRADEVIDLMERLSRPPSVYGACKNCLLDEAENNGPKSLCYRHLVLLDVLMNVNRERGSVMGLIARNES